MSVHKAYQIVYIINLLKEQALLIFGQVQVKLHVLQEAINVFLVILIQPINNKDRKAYILTRLKA